MKFRYQLLSFVILSFAMAMPAYAANVNFSENTTVTFTAGNCTILQGSTATTVDVNATQLVLTQSAGEDFTIRCPSTVALTSTPTVGENCVSGGGRDYHITAGITLTTVFVSATTSSSCGSSTGGSGSSSTNSGGTGGTYMAPTPTPTVLVPKVEPVKVESKLDLGTLALPVVKKDELVAIKEEVQRLSTVEIKQEIVTLKKVTVEQKKDLKEQYTDQVKALNKSDLKAKDKKKALAELRKSYNASLKDVSKNEKSMMKILNDALKASKKKKNA